MYPYQRQELKMLLGVIELPEKVDKFSASMASKLILKIKNQNQKDKEKSLKLSNNLESTGLFNRWLEK